MSNTIQIGKVYQRFEVLPSTNDFAAELLSKSRPAEGTVVRADSQSAGRGQFGSRWESSAGKNLLVSIIFYPKFLEPSEQFRLNEAVALAVRSTVAQSLSRDDFDAKVKWPNDIFLNGKKVAGILIQNSLSGSEISSSIVGIGLNVNELEFPNAVRGTATSLCLVENRGRDLHEMKVFDLDEVAQTLFKNLEINYLKLQHPVSREAMRRDFQTKMLHFEQVKKMERAADGSQFLGRIVEVARDGRLVVENLGFGGRLEFFSFKEIKVLSN